MTRRLLRARWVVATCEPPIENGVVEIEDGRIAKVRNARPGEPTGHDLGDAVLLPGLVNAHTHLEFSGLGAPLGEPGMALPDWIRLVIGQRGRGDDSDRAAALRSGLAESLRNGVTTVVDIATSSRYPRVLPSPSVLPLLESIGFSAARVDSAFAQLMDDFERLAASGDAGLSPHAPYTVHPDLLRRIVDAAAKRGALAAMHLAESPEELRLLADGDGPFRELLEERSMWDPEAIPPESSPQDYLNVLADAPRSLVVHGNYLSASEQQFCAERRDRMAVVYCPRTHAFFGHEPYPLAELLRLGVRVLLGTDSRASNPDLSVLAEMREAAERHPAVSPAELLGMATLESATAIGRADEIGSLTPAKRADMVAVGIGAEAGDPLEAVVRGKGEVEAVWLGGERVDQ